MASTFKARSQTSLSNAPGVQREPWESRYHWLCRRKFIEDHKNMYSLERAVCLSMVWANVNFLESHYSSEVENLVEYYPVPEKSELERWLNVHEEIKEEDQSSLRKDEVKITAKRTLDDRPPYGGDAAPPVPKRFHSTSDTSQPLPPSSSKDDDSTDESMSYSDLSQHLSAIISTMRKEQDSSSAEGEGNAATLVDSELKSDPRWKRNLKLLSCWCLCPKCFGGDVANPLCALDAVCAKSKLTLEYFDKPIGYEESSSVRPDAAGQTVQVLVNGVFMSSFCSKQSKKNAKWQAAQALMNEIQQHQENIGFECPAVGRRVVHLEDISKGQAKDERISESNKGHQMLQKMGWSQEKGLGLHGQGKQDPVVCTIRDQRDREGLGAGAQSNLSRDVISTMLHDFLLSDEMQLEFSPDLTSEDRKTVHMLAERYHLGHKSQGSGSSRYLILVKKEGFNYQQQQKYINEVGASSGMGPIRHRNESNFRQQPYTTRKPYQN